jgi:hypothetical protein
MKSFYEKKLEYAEKVVKIVLSKCGEKVDELEIEIKSMNACEGKAKAMELIDLVDLLIMSHQELEIARNLLKEENER